jgi:CO/xanthine dehydrogenase Mo-binding subunit
MVGDREVEAMQPVAQPVLAREKVCYVGQPVAIVVAEDRYLARDTMDCLHVDYEPLPPVLDPFTAMQEDASLIHTELRWPLP